jgi:hypothetical protein
MRKSISIYNHKKFAQKVDDVNADYINKLLAKPGDVTQEFVYYIVRVYFGDDQLATIKKSGMNYDKTVYNSRSAAGMINKIYAIDKDPRITVKNKYKDVSTKAVDFIKNKLKQNEGTSAPAGGTQQPAGPPMASPGAGTAVTPSAQVPVSSPNQVAQQAQVTPEQADAYLTQIIPVLKTLSEDKSKPGAFTQRYSNEYNDVIYAMNILKSDSKFFEKLEKFNTTFKTLAPIYNNAMHPTGWTAAGNSVFVTDWYTLGDQIINEIQSSMIKELKEDEKKLKIQNTPTKISTFQTEFLNKNPKNTDISGVANKVNQVIDQFNIGKSTGDKLTRLK